LPLFRQTIPIDDYVLDILMRDIVGHDRQPAAYLVYLYLYGQAVRNKWKPVPASLRALADATGLSKSAVQKRDRELAPPRVNRNHQRSCHRRSRAPSPSSLAHALVAAAHP